MLRALFLSLIMLISFDISAHAEEMDAKLTQEQAVAVVMQKYPGTIVEVELDKKDGHAHYIVTVYSSSGKTKDVYVDANTGKITHTE